MTDYLYHQWAGGLIFGVAPDASHKYGLIDADGLMDASSRGGLLPEGGGRTGRGSAPLWVDVGGWTTRVDIIGKGLSESDWVTRRDALLAATIPSTTGEHEYAVAYGTEAVRSVFARVKNRSIPTNRDLLVDRFTEAQIQYLATDPLTYGPSTTVTLAPSVASGSITVPGWMGSQRWRFVAPGPVTNPRLTMHAAGYSDQIVRFVGTVADGQNFVLESHPDYLVHTVGGPSHSVFGDLDGGNTNTPAQFFTIPSGVALTFTFSGGGSPDDATITYRNGVYL